MTDIPEPKCLMCSGRGYIVGDRDERFQCHTCTGSGIHEHPRYARSAATLRAALAHQMAELKTLAKRTEQAFRRASYREDFTAQERDQCRRKADRLLNSGPRVWDEIPDGMTEETDQ